MNRNRSLLIWFDIMKNIGSKESDQTEFIRTENNSQFQSLILELVIQYFNREETDMEPQSRCIMKMLEDNFYEENSGQELIGMKVLDLFYLKVKQSETDQKLLKKNFITNAETLGDTIIEKIGISDTSHLKMCLGSIVIDGKYQKLVEIQSQMLQLLGKKEEKKKTLQFSMNDTLSSQNTFAKQKSVFNPYKQESTLTEQSTTFDGETKYHPPTIIHEESKFNESTLSTIMSNLTISGINNKTQSSFDLSGIDLHSGPIDPANEQLFKNFQVEYYLQNEIISHNSELNLLLQQNAQALRYGSEKDKMNLEHPIKTCFNTIIVKDILTGKEKEIKAEGTGKNKKDAKADFSFKVLRIIYTEFPGIAFKMKLLKQQKGIKH